MFNSFASFGVEPLPSANNILVEHSDIGSGSALDEGSLLPIETTVDGVVERSGRGAGSRRRRPRATRPRSSRPKRTRKPPRRRQTSKRRTPRRPRRTPKRRPTKSSKRSAKSRPASRRSKPVVIHLFQHVDWHDNYLQKRRRGTGVVGGRITGSIF